MAGAIKTAIGAAVTAVTEVAEETPGKKAEKKAPAKKAAKKAIKKTPVKKSANKTPARKAAAVKKSRQNTSHRDGDLYWIGVMTHSSAL